MISAYHKISSAADGKKTGDGHGVGFFIPITGPLSDNFPDGRGDDDKSPPHVTFLYVGNVPANKQDELAEVATGVFTQWIRGTVRGHLVEQIYFDNPYKYSRVAVMSVRFSHDLSGLRWRLRDALIDAGFEVDDSFPLVYKPHSTLQYLDGIDSTYNGEIPTGDWDFDSIEVWGASKVYSIEFGSNTRMASRVVDAMLHEVSVGLIKFLSAVSRKLGVSEHVYVVGGAVRNFVIGQPIKDIDVVIDSVALGGKDSEWFANQLRSVIPANTNLTTNNYGVAILTISGDWEVAGHNLKGEVIEIANARTESYTHDTYKPNEVTPATIEDDTYRREFTFNTLLWRMHDLADGPDRAPILDLTGCGMEDLKNGIMRCPSDPDKTFGDDPSRMIRAIKFLIKYGFKISPEVETSIKKNREKIRNIPPGHLSNMIVSLFYETGVGKRALLEMDKLGMLDVVKDIAKTNKPFREALANWAEKKAGLGFVFDLMDMGMPVGKSLGFLDQPQKSRVREITVNMTVDDGESFIIFLEQPGKVIDMQGMIDEFGLRGSQIRDLVIAARTTLLSDPVLAASPRRWESRIRTELTKQGKTAKTFTLNPGDPVLFGKWKNKRGIIRDFGVNEKGDQTVTIEMPNGGVQVVNLFKIREPRVPVDPVPPSAGDTVTSDMAGHTPEYVRLNNQYNVMNRTAARVAAKYQNKKKVKPKDGGEPFTVYEYSEQQIANRHKEKAERIDKLRGNIGKLQAQYRKDLKSSDEKTMYTALAVGLMDVTFERVGNDESAGDGHFGVTGWQKKHVKLSSGKATITYVGKSGVDHVKEVTDSNVLTALKSACAGKKDSDLICEGDDCRVTSTDVNAYLKPFGITAKDIRGFHANDEMQTRLKAARSSGGKLPSDPKEREKKLKDEFKKALDETAEAVGHESSTLRSQYLVPGLEDEYMKDGDVSKSFKKTAMTRVAFDAAKSLLNQFIRRGHTPRALHEAGINHFRLECHYCGSVIQCRCRHQDQGRMSVVGVCDRCMSVKTAVKTHAENEDDEAQKLVRESPKLKPPRHDLRNERMEHDKDPDMGGTGASEGGDRDLTLNYKRVANMWLASSINRVIVGEIDEQPIVKREPRQHRPGDVWTTEDGWAAKNPDGVSHAFTNKPSAEEYAKGKSDDGDDRGSGKWDQEKQTSLIESLARNLDAGRNRDADDVIVALKHSHPHLSGEIDKRMSEYKAAGIAGGKAYQALTKAVDKKDKAEASKAVEKATSELEASIKGIRELAKVGPNDKPEAIAPEAPKPEAPKPEAPKQEVEAPKPEAPKQEAEAPKQEVENQGGPSNQHGQTENEPVKKDKETGPSTLSIGGIPVSDNQKTTAQLIGRANSAYDDYVKADPSSRSILVRRLDSSNSKAKDGTNGATEIGRIIDGINLASIITDGKQVEIVDGDNRKFLGKPMSNQYIALANALAKTGAGNEKILLNQNSPDVDSFYGPRGRELLFEAMHGIDDSELLAIHGGDEHMSRALSNPTLSEGSKEQMRMLIRNMAAFNMTVCYAALLSNYNGPDNSPANRQIDDILEAGDPSGIGIKYVGVGGDISGIDDRDRKSISDFARGNYSTSIADLEKRVADDVVKMRASSTEYAKAFESSDVDKIFLLNAEFSKAAVSKHTRTPEEKYRDFMSHASPDTRERMKDVTPKKFMEMMAFITFQ